MNSLKQILSLLETYLDSHTDLILDYRIWLEWGTDATTLFGTKLHIHTSLERAMELRSLMKEKGKKVLLIWQKDPPCPLEPLPYHAE